MPLPTPQCLWSHIALNFISDHPESSILFSQVVRYFGISEDVVIFIKSLVKLNGEVGSDSQSDVWVPPIIEC